MMASKGCLRTALAQRPHKDDQEILLVTCQLEDFLKRKQAPKANAKKGKSHANGRTHPTISSLSCCVSRIAENLHDPTASGAAENLSS